MFSCKYCEISKKPILKICVCLLLKRLQEVIDLVVLSRGSLSKPSWLSNFTKTPVVFKLEPSLNLIPVLYFEFRFPMFIINAYDRKTNACSPWTSCSNITLPINISIKFRTTYHKSLFITTLGFCYVNTKLYQ